MSLEERSSRDGRPRIAAEETERSSSSPGRKQNILFFCLALLPVNIFKEIKIIAKIKPFFNLNIKLQPAAQHPKSDGNEVWPNHLTYIYSTGWIYEITSIFMPCKVKWSKKCCRYSFLCDASSLKMQLNHYNSPPNDGLFLGFVFNKIT